MINDDASIIVPILNELRSNFQQNKTRSVAFRKQQLTNLLNGMQLLKDQFLDAIGKDLGNKNKFQCEMMQFGGTISHIRHDIDHVEEYSKKRSVNTTLGAGPGKSYIIPEPRGVVLVMGAWNYPLFTLIPAAATCIAAGNAVILKPSELSPHTSNLIAKLFKDHLDNGLYRVIEGAVNVAINLTKQPLDLIFFVGGTEKGKLVAKAAAENLVPCILELGGKSPCIVDGTGDLEMIGRRICQTKFTNCGQTCVAPDFILVKEESCNNFIKALQASMKQTFGENSKESQYSSRMVNNFHTSRVIESLKNHGGQVVVGGNYDLQEKWIEPTIIVNPNPNSKLMKEEIFGPLLPVITYKNNDEMLDFINSRAKPLALYYYGTNNETKQRILDETSSGGVCVNDCLFHILNPELPFGGVGNSGYGSINGKLGYDQCCHLKSVLEKSTIDPLVRYPPYNVQKQKILSFLFKHGNLTQFQLSSYIGIGVLLLILAVIYINCGEGEL